MKILTVSVLVFCAMMSLTRGAEEEAVEDPKGRTNAAAQTHVKSRVGKRSTSCPGGWTEIQGRCFKYLPDSVSWARAEKNCQSMGANLASVRNIHEYQEIQNLIRDTSYGFNKAWIGGSDAQEEGVWLWSDGSRFNYVNWCPGQPDNKGGKQHCIQINYSERKCWDDLSCTQTLPYVCATTM